MNLEAQSEIHSNVFDFVQSNRICADDQFLQKALQKVLAQQTGDPNEVRAVSAIQWLSAALRHTVLSQREQTCQSALILLGYFCRDGLYGFKADLDEAQMWLDAAHAMNPHSSAWDDLARIFWMTDTLSGLHHFSFHALELLKLGEFYDAASCYFTLGYFYANGVVGVADIKLASHYYQLSTKKGCATAANNLAYLYLEQSLRTQNPQIKAEFEHLAIGSLLKAIDLGFDNKIEEIFKQISSLHTMAARQQQLPLIRKYAKENNPIAMACLSSLLGEYAESPDYDYAESVYWIHEAQKIAPEHPYIKKIINRVHQGDLKKKFCFWRENRKLNIN